MELATWITFIILWTAASGQDEFPVNPDTQNYQYKYFVRDEGTGDIKSHEEKKVGDTVSGQYTVGEPTGDLRVVSYTADEGGFRANVKFEEGGSPLSDIRDKERQVNPTSGFQFEWLPGNPDDAQQAAEKTTSDEDDSSNGDSKATEEDSMEGKGSTEGGSESTPTQTEENYSESMTSEGTTPEAKKDDSSSEESDEKMLGDGSQEMKEPEASGESEVTDDSKGDTNESSEGKDSEDKESEGKESKESSDASESEAAESSPTQEVAPTEPSQSYLPPPLPMQNLPFYNLPVAQPTLQENDRPTIIYASQNFYNPWQWFGTTRVQRQDPPAEEPHEHYMTGLGYIIVPHRHQE